jgi:hypothetical protein
VYKSTLTLFETADFVEAFPRARFVHIVRHPCAVYASQKRRQPRKGRLLNPAYEVASLCRGLAAGRHNRERLGAGRYHIVRYEDLVEDPDATLRALAAFAGVPFEPILSEPTDGGLAASANTGYGDKHARKGTVSRETVTAWVGHLGPEERYALAACLAPHLPYYGFTDSEGAPNGVLRALWRLRRASRLDERVETLRCTDVLRLWCLCRAEGRG